MLTYTANFATVRSSSWQGSLSRDVFYLHSRLLERGAKLVKIKLYGIVDYRFMKMRASIKRLGDR